MKKPEKTPRELAEQRRDSLLGEAEYYARMGREFEAYATLLRMAARQLDWPAAEPDPAEVGGSAS